MAECADNITNTTHGISLAEIAEAAASPASFSVDGLSQTSRSIGELIAADKYLRKRALLGRRGRSPLSVLVSRMICPGPGGC